MTIVNLYRYNESGVICITPIQRERTDVPYKFRLIASEGKVVTDGNIALTVVDIATADIGNWYEDEILSDTEALSLIVRGGNT